MATHPTHIFYASCDPAHREFFSALLFDWQETGQIVEVAEIPNDMSAESGAALLRVRSLGRAVSAVGDAVLMPCLFVLHAGDGIEPARISMDLDRWREWFGPEERDLFVQELEAMPGLKSRRRGSDFALLEPAHLSGPGQQKLRHLITGFGRGSREDIGL